MVASMTNEKERLLRSRFPDSRGPSDFVLPANVESALLSNIAHRESFSSLKEFKLQFPLTRWR